uniref:Uncharacterized protein n=1 Tax=Oncorhynchus tshawytscha TaxID=74940 RepID=A0A8C8IKQ5_ONCTS
MSSISIWMCLVLTICTWHKTIGCTWMKTPPRSPSMFQVFSNNTITMLQKMVGYSDVFHLFLADEQIAFISQTLNAIKKLYSSGKYESTSSNQKAFDKFMNDLYRQTSELDQCVKYIHQIWMYLCDDTTFVYSKILTIVFLFMQEYSASGWEDIRSVVLAHLQRLDMKLSSQ